MSMLKKVFLRISGNRAVQGAIENKVQSLQELLGIGSGDGVLFSGEQAVFDILRQKFNPPYCIFDVGANQGQFLRLLLEHIPLMILPFTVLNPDGKHSKYWSLL